MPDFVVENENVVQGMKARKKIIARQNPNVSVTSIDNRSTYQRLSMNVHGGIWVLAFVQKILKDNVIDMTIRYARTRR